MIEIERKFLVNAKSYRKEAYKKTRIVQGFLNTDPLRTVRVRIKGDQGFLTVKGKSNDSGTSRFEWERKIAKMEAEALLILCEEGIIEKVRYEVRVMPHIFEIDEFLGANEGLIVAEVELGDEQEAFKSPDWIGKEVTGEVAYYNAQLSKNPFKNWQQSSSINKR